MPDDHSCWTCAFHAAWGPETFLGDCKKITRNNEAGKKPIPGHIVDHGCKFWQEKEAKSADQM